MIKLFVCDIDGCLAEPYQPFDLLQLQRLREHAEAAGEPGAASAGPAVSICSGRAYSYVEAMTQLLGLRTPVLFESGGGCFDPVSTETTWNPAFTQEHEEALAEVGRFIRQDCLPGTSAKFDHTKRTQAGLVGPDTETIRRLLPKVRAFADEHDAGLRTFYTPVSIDVVIAGLTKKQGLAWLGERLGVPLEDMAYIGDTDGDIGALQRVGHSFAPANAAAEVQEAVQHVTEAAVIEGTLEAYQWCLAHNERQPARASS